MRAQFVRYVVAAVALSAAVAGCGGDEAPEASPAPSASTSASSSAPATPELPDAARGTGPKAAEAFVRHYVDLINHSLRTLETEPLARASSRECEACNYFLEALRTTASRDGRYEGGRWNVLRLAGDPGGDGTDYYFRARVELEAERVIQRRPRDVASLPRREATYTFVVRQAGRGLQMHAITEVTQ